MSANDAVGSALATCHSPFGYAEKDRWHPESEDIRTLRSVGSPHSVNSKIQPMVQANHKLGTDLVAECMTSLLPPGIGFAVDDAGDGISRHIPPADNGRDAA